MSRQMEETLKRREVMRLRNMSKAEKDILTAIEAEDSDNYLEDRDAGSDSDHDNDDEDAPPSLDDDEDGEKPTKRRVKSSSSSKSLPTEPPKEIVEEGDLPDDFIAMLDGPDDRSDCDAASQSSWKPREMSLLDERFDAMLGKYDDEYIGELDDEHPGLCPPGSEESYYALLDQYIAAGKAPQVCLCVCVCVCVCMCKCVCMMSGSEESYYALLDQYIAAGKAPQVCMYVCMWMYV